jgi:hypothetical protein
MRYILEFNEYQEENNDMKSSDKYKVVKWEHGTNDEETDDYDHEDDMDQDMDQDVDLDVDDKMDFFDVWVEDESGEEHKIAVNYQMFIEFIQEEMPNLKSYLSNADFANIDEMLADLEELGIDMGEILQKWVDDNVTEETINVDNEDEEGEGMFTDEEGDIHSDYNEDEEDLDEEGFDEEDEEENW